MAKGISILTIVCLCFMLGMGVRSYAQPGINPAESKEQIIKKHIEQVKLKNPVKYQEMVQRAGGNITQCTDCHQEVLKGKLPSQKGMESIRPLRK